MLISLKQSDSNKVTKDPASENDLRHLRKNYIEE